ncbi:hypothetical protein JCM10450v2_005316 [Rhodotorula kratochvilovae]
MAIFRQQSPLPWRSPHAQGYDPVGASSVTSSLFAALRGRSVALIALAVLSTFGLLSLVSPFGAYTAAFTDVDSRAFSRRGLAPHLFRELDQIDHRAAVLRPVERAFVRERRPEDPVPWSADALLPPRSAGSERRKAAQLRLAAAAGTEDAAGDGMPVPPPARTVVDEDPVPTHRVEVFPRKIALVAGQDGVEEFLPAAERMMFGIVTTTQRAKTMSQLWTRWMVPQFPDDEGTPTCLVLLSEEEVDEDIEDLKQVLRARNLPCGVRKGKYARYEVRVLSMVKEMKNYADDIGQKADWFIFNDDDTFWLDMRATRRMLSKYNPQEQWFIGATTEAQNQLAQFGRMAFGGAGMLVSQAMITSMYSTWNECHERYKDVFGGDEMLTRCAAVASGRTKQTVTTEERGLHQFDIPGDTTGVLQGGIPMLSMHHFMGGGWVHLFAYGSLLPDMAQIGRVRAAADFLGGDNMFQRYVFGDGKWLVTLGYSVTYFEQPLKREELALMEHTWYENYRLSFEDRPHVQERHDPKGRPAKQTFYIDSTEVVSPKSALFTFVQADSWDEHLSNDERVRIKLLWDGDQTTVAHEQDPAALS